MGEANKDKVADILLSMRYNPRITSLNLEISGSEQLDLSLGLSLGGCYSQISEEKPLIRTSSLNRDLTLNENYEGGRFLSLERSSSLPTTMGEQELRKVKEMQAMKRMEAKKRLLEKHRHRRGSSSEEEKLPAEAKLSNWAIESSRKNTAYFCAIEKIKSNVRPSANHRIQAKVPTISQRTVTPRAMENGKSVYAANYRSEPVVNSGTMENGQSTDPANYHSAQVITLEEMQNGKRVNPDDGDPFEPAESEQERPSKKLKVLDNGVHEMTAMEMMKLMPTVTTTGDGPNGTTIEGFLYKYKKGQVTIVCICHGRFLSPAEFVKHAGGSDVENPMKHINVLPATL